MKEIMEKIGTITFETIDEVYEDRVRYRNAVLLLDQDTLEIYKWYFYHQLCLLTQKQYELKDLMWEYLVGKNVECDLIHQYKIYMEKKMRMYRKIKREQENKNIINF